jgi:hypothetical protein
VKITVHIIIIIVIIIHSHSIDSNLVIKPMDMEILRGLNRDTQRDRGEGEGDYE